MEKMLNNKKIYFALVLILVFMIVNAVVSERFFHQEMLRQIDDTLKVQSDHIMEGYDPYEQNEEILRTGVRADTLELNRIHGEFLLKSIDQIYRESLPAETDSLQVKQWVTGIVQRSEENISLKGTLIWDASLRQDELDTLIRQAVQRQGETISYQGKPLSELFRLKALDLMIESSLKKPWETYARAVYFQPLDLVVVIKDTARNPEDLAGEFLRKNTENLERSIMMIGTMEDVIVLQKSGYSLYSGRFGADGKDRRITRILYNDTEDPAGLFSRISGKGDGYQTLQVPIPDGKTQERYCYIAYDSPRNQYIILSRPVAAIRTKEGLLEAVSRFAGIINVIVVSLLSAMLITRDEALKEGDVNL